MTADVQALIARLRGYQRERTGYDYVILTQEDTAQVLAALQARDTLAAQLKTIEWAGCGVGCFDACPACGGIEPQPSPLAIQGHNPGCWIAAALRPPPTEQE